MVEKIRVGIIGASKYCELRHIPALKRHPHVDLVAICDIDRKRVKEVATRYSIPLVTGDYREAIDEGELNALLVVTPDSTHHEITMRALDAKLHVLCEKPLAHNTVQAREMYERAEAIGVKHMTFFTFRWLPQYVYLKKLIDDGYVGKSYDFYISLLTSTGRSVNYSWRHDQRYGNGVLGEYGAHMIDLSRWLVGDLSRVNAQLRMTVDRTGPDGLAIKQTNDSAVLSVEFSNGAQGMIQLSSMAYIGENAMDQRIILHGEKGTLEVRATFTNAEVHGLREGERDFSILPIPKQIMDAVDMNTPFHVRNQPMGDYIFVDSITENQKLSPSFYDGLRAMEVIDAAKKSNEKGLWIAI